MPIARNPINARSWLFAPGDSSRKMEKASESETDIVLLDLEDSVSPEKRPEARKLVNEHLDGRSDKERQWVRINPLASGEAEADLAAVMPACPGGILLPKAEGRKDIERLDHYLTAFEAAFGMEQGQTKIAALVTETPAAMFTTGDYADMPRIIGLAWGAEDLSAAIGARQQKEDDGNYAHTFELARTLCLLGASAAGLLPIETVHVDFRDSDGLRQRAEKVRQAGFRAMMAIHPSQVPIINDAFTPSADEIAHARAVIAAFDANPGAGTVGLDGKMLDRPHLALAKALIASADAV